MKTSNRTITFLLTLLLLGIWGTIVYQLFIADNSSAPRGAADEADNKWRRNSTTAKYEYTANVRDPFGLIVPARKDTILKKIVQLPIWAPPPFKLTGIVMNNKKRTAMLESAGGEVYFLREGDSLGSVKIQSIRQSIVTYSYLNSKGVWNIER